jgi:hypothetical protein
MPAVLEVPVVAGLVLFCGNARSMQRPQQYSSTMPLDGISVGLFSLHLEHKRLTPRH